MGKGYADRDRYPERVGQGWDEPGGLLTCENAADFAAQLRFLTDVTNALATAVDDEAMVRRAARLVVPALADWCAVHLADADGGSVRRVAVVHVDPRQQAVAEQLLAPEGPAEAIAFDEETGTTTVLAVPMTVRDRPVGVLTLGLDVSGRRYHRDDVPLAEEVARRCALALDNARLHQETRRLETVFANTPVGLAFFDVEGRQLKANEALNAMQGLPVAEQQALHRRVVETGAPIIDFEIEGETPARPGELRSWLSSWFPVRNADGSLVGVGSVVHDTTDRRQADAELARRVAQQAAVATLGRQALAVDVDELLRLAPRLVAEALDVARSAVLEAGADGRDHVVRAAYGGEPEAAEMPTVPATLVASGPLVDDRHVFVAIRHHRGAWGILSAHSATERQFDRHDVDFLESVAAIVGETVSRAATENELRRRAEQQAAVAEFGRMAIVGTPVAELYRRALTTLTTTLDVSHAALVEQVGDGGGLVTAVRGWPADVVGTVVPAGRESQAGYTLLAGEPVVVEDMRTETRFTPSPVTVSEGLVSSISTVVRGIGRNFGVLSVHSRERRQFTVDDVYFLRSIANVLAAALGRNEAEEELRQERQRLRLALDAGRLGDWEWDIATDTVTWSEGLERIFGLLPGTFGRTFADYLELIHPDDREATVDAIQRALAERRQFNVEHRVRFADGYEHWINGMGRVVLNDDGKPTGMIGVAGDVTDRVEGERIRNTLLAAEQDARAQAEAARSRLEFLAEASAALSTSLNYRRTLAKVANLAVPRLADWCGVDVLEDDRAPNQMAIAHSDPEKLALAQAMQRRYPVDPAAKGGVSYVIRTGVSQLVPVVDDAMLVDAARDEEHLRMLRELGLHSVMIVPLVARGRSIGAITFVSAESQRVYGPDDLGFAEDLARRAAAAIDNARLYQDRSVVARALQRSLLPPEIPFIRGLEVADRYRPMSEQSEIGGDFYDVFESSDGSWCLVVGDVCGKGPEAAAVTGLARSTLRAVALHDPAPARVLGLLNEALYRNQNDSRFCTVAFARLVPGVDGATATLSCGGHPLPLVVRRNGRVEPAGATGTLLGVFEQATLAAADVALAPGDALVFYTDGVTEARRDGEVFGEARLAELLRSVAGSEPDEMADAIEDAIVTWQPEHRGDDLALLVVRVPAA